MKGFGYTPDMVILMGELKRSWTFIAYPDDSSSNIVDSIRDLRVSACISPLHSPVMDNGDEGKRHYHVMLYFSGKKSDNQVNDIIVNLRNLGIACTKAFPVSDKTALVAYFVHDGYPDKEQFRYSDLTLLNGFKLSGVADSDSMVWDVIDWCNTAGVYNWAQVVDYARSFMPEWKIVLFSNKSYPIMAYLKNARELVLSAHVCKESEVDA